MPNHVPTEPPDESHGWEDEYDTIMKTVESKAMLTGLGRTENRYDGVDRAATPVETDDDALQAFVQMVYDRGIAHGSGLAADEAAHASLAEELDAHRQSSESGSPTLEYLRSVYRARFASFGHLGNADEARDDVCAPEAPSGDTRDL